MENKLNNTNVAFPQNASKLDIKIFDQKDSYPFQSEDMDLSAKNIYELHDETLRTPIEKAEVFEQLLTTQHACELWIIPVTEDTSSITKSIKEEKTSALFTMLSLVRDKIQRDRTFLVVDNDCTAHLLDQLASLGYTAVQKSKEDLSELKVEY